VITVPDTGKRRFYCIRQARTKIVGSRTMTADEAGREAAVWRDEIGPATVVVADAESRRAVRTEDQAALAKLLNWDARRDLVMRTAPAWNCVANPGDGMHYTPGGTCLWCGMTRAQIMQQYGEKR
jgi:hypothetical protein